MSGFIIQILRCLRKIYTKINKPQVVCLQREENPDKVSEMIYDLLASDKPCMIARFGSTELACLVNYISIKKKQHSVFKYVKGEERDWWWNKNIMQQMQEWSGFFPPTEEKLSQFCEMMLEDTKELDLLGSWVSNEMYISDLIHNIPKVHLIYLEPYFGSSPWSRILKGKKVLVVHPYAKSIEKQYAQREKLFKNPDVLPEFDLQTIQAVQSLGGDSNGFKDWFEALDWMKSEIDRRDYDICLIGCGAYGFPLAAHVKRTGKKAIHIGGALQLLFGIKGKRWEDPNYGTKKLFKCNPYLNIINEYWIYPEKKEISSSLSTVENGCYC